MKKINFNPLEYLFQFGTKISSYFMIILFLSLMVLFIHASLPAITQFGFSFLVHSQWDPVQNQFGAFPAIAGTLISSFLALALALPLSLGMAAFIYNSNSNPIGKYFRFSVDLMASVPSVVYGIWAFWTLGVGLLSASLILTIMIIPIITSTMLDVLHSIPRALKESSYGLGLTPFETFAFILVPYTKKSILGCALLGLARALGETMAVTFVIGNSKFLPSSIFDPATTISATIANEFSEATGALYPSALLELGLILFCISFLTLFISRTFLLRKEY